MFLFLGERVLYVVHLINRTPSRVLENKTLYELIFGHAPKSDLLWVLCRL